MRNSKVLAMVALSLALAEVMLILVSWLLTAAVPEASMRSLLSSEGIRWFFGHFSDNLATPVLVWLLLVSIAYGAMRSTGLLGVIVDLMNKVFRKKKPVKHLDFQQRFAVRLVVVELIAILVVMVLLTAVPHAVLLSVTGDLFPSSFSKSLIPSVCFSCCVFSISYAMMSGRMKRLKEILYSLSVGLTYAAPWFLIYVLGAELYFSIRFVFMMG